MTESLVQDAGPHEQGPARPAAALFAAFGRGAIVFPARHLIVCLIVVCLSPSALPERHLDVKPFVMLISGHFQAVADSKRSDSATARI